MRSKSLRAILLLLIRKLKVADLFYLLFGPSLKPVILCFHRINEESIESQLNVLKKYFEILPLEDLINKVFIEKVRFRKPVVAITQDDCRIEDFNALIRWLLIFKMPCTYFVPTGYSINKGALWHNKIIFLFEKTENTMIDLQGKLKTFNTEKEKLKFRDNMILKFQEDETQTCEIEKIIDQLLEQNNIKLEDKECTIGPEQIKEFANLDLFTFQSHSVNHSKFYLSSKDEILDEFVKSKLYLNNLSNKRQNIICYPYGSERIIGNSYLIAKEYFEFGVSLKPGYVHSKLNRLLIPRIGIYEKDLKEAILLKIIIANFYR